MFLGVEQTSEMVFEGNSPNDARVVWPPPLLIPAKFIVASDNRVVPTELEIFGNANYLFREVAFDPVTRIRRGRFYKRRQVGQPESCRVMVAPPVSANAGLDNRPLYSYESFVSSELVVEPNQQIIVVLGAGEAFSVWTVINKETIHTREILVSLKSRQSLGALPEIDWSRLPDKSGLVREKIESLLDDIYRAGAESIVDRAREAATAILSAHLQSEGVAEASGKDLGALIDLLEKRNGKNSQRIVRCAAEIPQRLHSRVKHSEQEKHDNLRPIREQDAELAVQCIGVMLCDLGWGRWV